MQIIRLLLSNYVAFSASLHYSIFFFPSNSLILLVMRLLRSIAPFIFIPLIFLSTVGFSLDVHFCGGEVKSIGLYKTEPCQMEGLAMSEDAFKKLPPCHQKMMLEKQQKSPERNGYNADNCCHNEQFSFEGSSVAEVSVSTLLKAEKVQAVLIYTAINLQQLQVNQRPLFYAKYRPPLLRQDISVLYQVFRI